MMWTWMLHQNLLNEGKSIGQSIVLLLGAKNRSKKEEIEFIGIGGDVVGVSFTIEHYMFLCASIHVSVDKYYVLTRRVVAILLRNIC